jgi:signal transduction histidine kinase
VNGIPPHLSNEQQLTIFRIMQECLTNIVKHAKASRVQVNVDCQKNGLQMHIKDDGIGFNLSQTPRNHYGLINIKERARKVGGTVEIQSSPGEGTHVDLSITAEVI